MMTLPNQLILELMFMLADNIHCVIYRRSEQASGIKFIALLVYKNHGKRRKKTRQGQPA